MQWLEGPSGALHIYLEAASHLPQCPSRFISGPNVIAQAPGCSEQLWAFEVLSDNRVTICLPLASVRGQPSALWTL